MKLLAVGDIHGYLDKLEKLIAQVCPTQEDQVVFLGDYVDRGPNSAGVIDYLIGFAGTFPKTVFLQGNHEQMMLDFLHDRRRIPGWVPMAERSERYASENLFTGPGIWLANGGRECLESYLEDIPQEHIDFLLNTRLYFEFDKWIFVHADICPVDPLNDQDPYYLQWSRIYDQPPEPDYPGRIIVAGHTPRAEAIIGPHRIDMDTGAGMGGEKPLTCIDVLTGQIWQAGGDPDPIKPPRIYA